VQMYTEGSRDVELPSCLLVLLKLCPARLHAAVRCEEGFREKMSVITKLTLIIQLIINTFFFAVRLRPNAGHGLLILEVF
jgi:hypothetical protein